MGKFCGIGDTMLLCVIVFREAERMARIFYGWWVLAATSTIHMWAAGTFFYSFTAFFNPIINEFGWSYTATSIAASLRSIEGGLASPLVGFAADRYGSRRLLMAGGITSGLGFILFSRIQSLWQFYLVFIFLSVGVSLLLPIPGWTATANWFSKKRGLALGILSAAIGVGGMLIYLINYLLGTHGWRKTMVIIGIGFWLITIPCAWIVRQSPASMNLLPDGEPVPPVSPQASGPVRVGFNVMEALKTRAFWILAAIVTVSGGVMHSVTVHIMPYLLAVDMDRSQASLIASLLIAISVFGRFGLGWLSGRFEGRTIMALGLALQAIGCIFLVQADSFWKAMVFVAAFGPGFGGIITLRLVLQAEYFGHKSFGSIQGLIMAVMVLGSMSGPVLTGMVFDLYGTYSPAWQAMAILIFIMIPVSLALKRPIASQ